MSLMRAEPSASGAFSWLMFDYNTPRNAYFQKTICPNGIVDQYRIPKYTFYAYRARFDRAPMVFIADRWSAKERGNRKFVEVYSNCDSVELALNGRSLGMMKKMSDYPMIGRPPFRMDVPFEAGSLKATGFVNGKAVVEHTVRTPGKPVALKLAADYDTIYAGGGADWTRVVVSLVDANGTVVVENRLVGKVQAPALRMVKFKVSGEGSLIGDNPVMLEAGQMAVLACSSDKPGKIVVTAESDGMRPASLTIETKSFPATPDYAPQNDLAAVWKTLVPGVKVDNPIIVKAKGRGHITASSEHKTDNYGKPCTVIAKLPVSADMLKEHKRCGMQVKDGKAVYIGRLERYDGPDASQMIAVGIPVKGIPYDNVHETVFINKQNVISVKFED
jgi:hypothetical protein